MAKSIAACALFGAALLVLSCPVEARDRLLIVGSSTVFPFAKAVAEKVGRNGLKHPIVESTGSGAGFDLFCKGVGTDTPDISNASRRIKPSELERCIANGVTPVEVKIGFDGIILANSKSGPKLSLTVDQIFQALAKRLLVDERLQQNPNIQWSDIDPTLPTTNIEVLGPPPTSGTRDAFEELVMKEGCSSIPDLERENCTGIRRDGSFVESGENDDLIVGALQGSTGTVGIFGYSFLAKNLDEIQSVSVNGIEPTFDNIASGEYPVSRPLFFYIKKEHIGVVPGIEEYADEFLNEGTLDEEGYLPNIGLIPLVSDARKRQAENLYDLTAAQR